MAECEGAAKVPGVSSRLPGGGLYIFYTKLTAYLKSPVTLVFVFDGDGRPGIKRSRKVVGRAPWWIDVAQELIVYFGYNSHQVTSFQLCITQTYRLANSGPRRS
jgi:hypothetical protein